MGKVTSRTFLVLQTNLSAQLANFFWWTSGRLWIFFPTFLFYVIWNILYAIKKASPNSTVLPNSYEIVDTEIIIKICPWRLGLVPALCPKRNAWSLTPSCSSLLRSHGLEINTSYFVLHIDTLIIRGIMLVPWVLQKQPFTRKYLSWKDEGIMYKNNDCLSNICRNLVKELTSTRINRLRTKKFHDLSQTPSGTQISAVVNHLLLLLFSPSLIQKKPEFCT